MLKCGSDRIVRGVYMRESLVHITDIRRTTIEGDRWQRI